MQPREIQKQSREQKVPVTIKSSITLLLRIQHHVHMEWGSRGGPQARHQSPGNMQGEQRSVEHSGNRGRAYAPLTTWSTWSPFLVKELGPSFIHTHGPTMGTALYCRSPWSYMVHQEDKLSRMLPISRGHWSYSSSSQLCRLGLQFDQFAPKWSGPAGLPCADQSHWQNRCLWTDSLIRRMHIL